MVAWPGRRPSGGAAQHSLASRHSHGEALPLHSLPVHDRHPDADNRPGESRNRPSHSHGDPPQPALLSVPARHVPGARGSPPWGGGRASHSIPTPSFTPPLIRQALLCSGFVPGMYLIEMQFTYHKIHLFTARNSVGFSILTELDDHYCHIIPEHSHHPKPADTPHPPAPGSRPSVLCLRGAARPGHST